jgi:hypothetical protein
MHGNPMVHLLIGKTLAIRLMVAGKEIAVHDRKNTAPTKTACHAGINMAMQNPNIAPILKTSRARLVPIRSERYPL